MAYLGTVSQWGTYWADLDPALGSEQGGIRRPVLVVSNDGFNRRFPVVTILPITKSAGKTRRVYPFEVRLPAAAGGNSDHSIIMPQQIRTISKICLLESMGTIADLELRRLVEDRILDHLGIALDEPEKLKGP